MLKKLIYKYKQDIINMILLFAIITAIYLPSLLQHSMTWRSDAIFHLNRFYDLTALISKKQLPLLVNINSFGSTGQAVNAMYPFYGFLPLLIVTATLKPILQYFLLNYLYILIGSSINYFVFQKLGSTKKQAIVASVVCLSFIDVYNFSSFSLQGAWSAYFTIPLVLLSIKKIFENKRVYIIFLALAMSFAINIHILSSVLLFLVAVVYTLYLAFSYKKLSLTTILLLVMSGILTLLLSLPTLLSVIHFSHNQLSTPTPISLQYYTLNPESMLSSLSNIGITDFGNPTSPLYGLTLIFDVFSFFIWKKISKSGHLLLSSAFIIQIFISPYFPWKMLDKTPVSILQFPTRFVPIVLILFVITFYTEKKLQNKNFLRVSLVLSLIFSINYQTNNFLIKQNFPIFQINKATLNQSLIEGGKLSSKLDDSILQQKSIYFASATREYIPTSHMKSNEFDSNVLSVDEHTVLVNGIKMSNNPQITVNNNTIKYTFEKPISGKIDLPLWLYDTMNYTIKDNNDVTYHTSVSTRGTVLISGNDVTSVVVKIKNPSWFDYSIFISSTMLVLILMMLIFIYRKNIVMIKKR